ncbi:MAG: ABC transporter ATP-binding protein [Acidobacteria bacterium]|nr:ABC transporter ATP-binding protein [Acidobacteriota bacterium]
MMGTSTNSPPRPSAVGTDAAVIRTEAMTKTYRVGSEELHALSGITFTMERGEYVALMGPSGSGKSTLMNLLGCLDTPTSGRYWLAGRLVSELDDMDLALVRNREIGFVFQTFHLLPRFTAVGNVELPLIYRHVAPRERRELAENALRLVDLGDRLHHRPNELSGGQRQRVAIARALVTDPSILLADEPTGNLDSRTGAEIMKLFERLHGAGHTVVLITHDQDVAKQARRIIYIKDGRIERDERAK